MDRGKKMKPKTMSEIRDAEADKYALIAVPKGDYEFEGTFRGYVENYPSDDRRHIEADFKAGFDCRDALDNEALKLAVEALEFYNEVKYGPKAYDALAEIRKIMGEK
jgi:hypothetical protein